MTLSISYYRIHLVNCNTSLCQILLIRPGGYLGDAELNPGPKKSSSLSFFHRMIDGITARDFSKMVLIQSYAFPHNTDI